MLAAVSAKWGRCYNQARSRHHSAPSAAAMELPPQQCVGAERLSATKAPGRRSIKSEWYGKAEDVQGPVERSGLDNEPDKSHGGVGEGSAVVQASTHFG